MSTVLYIAINDRGVRITKYFMLLCLALLCLHLYNIKFEFYSAAFVLVLFLIDEWISLIPKIDKFNRMKLMGKQGYSLAEYSTIAAIELGYEFDYTNKTKAIKTGDFKKYCTFNFTTKGKDKTKYYVKDFDSIFKISKGAIKINLVDLYGIKTIKEYGTGETAYVGAYAIHSLESITDEVIIDFIATK